MMESQDSLCSLHHKVLNLEYIFRFHHLHGNGIPLGIGHVLENSCRSHSYYNLRDIVRQLEEDMWDCYQGLTDMGLLVLVVSVLVLLLHQQSLVGLI